MAIAAGTFDSSPRWDFSACGVAGGFASNAAQVIMLWPAIAAGTFDSSSRWGFSLIGVAVVSRFSGHCAVAAGIPGPLMLLRGGASRLLGLGCFRVSLFR